MRTSDGTTMGGTGSRLPETRWSLILGARTHDQTRRRLALTNIANAYWKPIYCHLRRRGYSNEEAKDLTQEFFCEFVLDGTLLQRADRALGCFRQLLSTALKRFTINVERDKNRKKRAPEGGMVALPATEAGDFDPPSSEATPEQAFYYAWVTSLLDHVLTETKQECGNAGLELHWQVFYGRVLAPLLNDAEETSFKSICQKYGMESESKAGNMVITVKRRFREVLRRRLRDLVGSDSQAETEFQEILRFLSEEGAGL